MRGFVTMVLVSTVSVVLSAASPMRAAQVGRPQAPRIEVVSFTPAEIVLGGRRTVMVRGLVANRGPGPAREIHVSLTARRAPGGEIIGTGSGMSWLGAMDEGEVGAFTAGLAICCLPDIGDYSFSTWAEPAVAPRYRDLDVDGLVRREVGAEHRIYGWLTNTGPAFLNASSLRVDAGFWKGDELIALHTARLPVQYSLDGSTGQSLPPAAAYPWAITFQDPTFDRYQVWVYAESFGADEFPIPLAADHVVAARAGDDVVVRGTVRNCGVATARAAVLVVVARDAEQQLLEFGRATLGLESPLAPGDRQPFALTWPAVGAVVETARVSAQAYAVETQAVRPREAPCAGIEPRGYVPWASVSAGGE